MKRNTFFFLALFFMFNMGCDGLPGLSITRTEPKSLVVSRTRLEHLHPDSAIVSGLVINLHECVCKDGDYWVVLKDRRVPINIIDKHVPNMPDSGMFAFAARKGECLLLTEHKEDQGLSAKIVLLLSGKDSVHVELKMGIESW